MFNELPESVDPIAFEALVQKRIAEMIPDRNTRLILDIIKRDPNGELLNLLEGYVNEHDAKIGLEDLKTYLEAHVWDKDRQLVSTFGIGTNPKDLTIQVVSQETYDSLKPLCSDISAIEAEVRDDLADKAK